VQLGLNHDGINGDEYYYPRGLWQVLDRTSVQAFIAVIAIYFTLHAHGLQAVVILAAICAA
jgi:hypothetical protein